MCYKIAKERVLYESAAGTLFACCGAVGLACLLLAGAFHVGVKIARYSESGRCMDRAVERGWIKPAAGVRP